MSKISWPFSLTVCLPEKSSNALWRLFRTCLSPAPHKELRLSPQTRPWNENNESTDSWVSISKHLSCFHLFCADSGLSTAHKALKTLALKSKAEIMPSPTKRIIQLLSLPVILMWFWSNWHDQHLVRLYGSCHSLTWHELEIKRAGCAKTQKRASAERSSWTASLSLQR